MIYNYNTLTINYKTITSAFYSKAEVIKAFYKTIIALKRISNWFKILKISKWALSTVSLNNQFLRQISIA